MYLRPGCKNVWSISFFCQRFGLKGDLCMSHPGGCACALCLTLRRISDIITGPGLTPIFREQCLREVQILQSRLLDLRDLHLVQQQQQQQQGASSGAPPPSEARKEEPSPGPEGTPASGSTEKPEVKPEVAKAEEAKEESEEKSAEESEVRASKTKKDRKRRRATRSRSRRRKSSRAERRSTSNRRKSRKERKEEGRPIAKETNSPLEVAPKEEPSTAELSREPLADVVERDPPVHPILASTPKVRARPPAGEASSGSREPLPRNPPREAEDRSRVRPREPSHSPTWRGDYRGYRDYHWSPPRSVKPKGKKKRERQERIRAIGWDAYHASKGRY